MLVEEVGWEGLVHWEVLSFVFCTFLMASATSLSGVHCALLFSCYSQFEHIDWKCVVVSRVIPPQNRHLSVSALPTLWSYAWVGYVFVRSFQICSVSLAEPGRVVSSHDTH
jgi:hypothetical protein